MGRITLLLPPGIWVLNFGTCRDHSALDDEDSSNLVRTNSSPKVPTTTLLPLLRQARSKLHV